MQGGLSVPANNLSLTEMQHRLTSTSRPNRSAATGRIAIVAATVIATNLIVFGCMLAGDNDAGLWHVDYLLAWGANYAPLTMNGQWWRLITCVFVHGGVLHLVFNLWMLWQLGRLVEPLVGRAGFVILYLACGLGSSMAGIWWSPFAVIAGASGAVFGLVGSIVACLILHRKNLQPPTWRRLRNSGLLFLGYNLVVGLLIEEIDMAGHVSGFVTGIACGLVLMRRPSLASSARNGRRQAQVVAAGAALLCCAFQVVPPAPPDFHREMNRFTVEERECIRRYSEAAQRMSDGALSRSAFVDVVETEVLPRWETAGERILSLSQHPAAKGRLQPELAEYVRARQESWRLLVTAIRSNNQGQLARHHEVWSAAENLARRISLGRRDKGAAAKRP
jgi:rhomboid protease GluP